MPSDGEAVGYDAGNDVALRAAGTRGDEALAVDGRAGQQRRPGPPLTRDRRCDETIITQCIVTLSIALPEQHVTQSIVTI